MENIILIGMPGSGKSTIGVVLAKIMGFRFIDSDLLIQEQERKLLHEIITEQGLDGFNKIENQVNASIVANQSVIATGGSVVYGEEAMKHLGSIGTIIYLQLSCESLKERLGDLEERGVSIREGQTLEELYEERKPMYEKYADFTVNCEKKEIPQIAREIVKTVQQFSA